MPGAAIADMVHPVTAQPGGTCWVVFDAGTEERCAYIPETVTLMELNAARIADPLPEPVTKIGVDPVTPKLGRAGKPQAARPRA